MLWARGQARGGMQPRFQKQVGTWKVYCHSVTELFFGANVRGQSGSVV